MTSPLLLSYAGCTTCKNALRWLRERDIAVDVRPIVEEPPTRSELATWIPKSGLSVRKWLNTSGQSYRALGKDTIANSSEEEWIARLSEDGKLVKRPVLVLGEKVLVGFREDAYAEAFSGDFR